MKKRWKIIAGILCITLMGTACSKKTINDGEEQQTTVDKTGKEENENQSKLDVLRPIAYSNVENLNLEPGSYISIIGRRFFKITILRFLFLHVRMEKRRGNYDSFCEKRRCSRNRSIDLSNSKRHGIAKIGRASCRERVLRLV